MKKYPAGKEPKKKKKSRLEASHYAVASIAGLLGGFLLQGPDFPLKPGAIFSLKNFISYTLLSKVAILAFMHLNRNRER